jgi:N-acetylglucosaminyldiphosphoundecaprenol N-acetyl-beta-D-mannosaminyltransferase
VNRNSSKLIKSSAISHRESEARKRAGKQKGASALRLCPRKNNHIDQDFRRDIYCLLGLPVDNLTMTQTRARLRQQASRNGNLVLSTINVNWVVNSFQNLDFRAAILNSDMVTIDGRPLLWLAKLMGYPMTEVVAGSTLIEELAGENNKGKQLTIFFFGGEDDAGRLAMERVNNSGGGLKGVGFLQPGFGTVEEMSSNAIIDTINSARPDILLVALGAQKGSRWIEHNRHRLNAKVISHLGATINFLAGKVERAPKVLNNLGLEWAWRILKEPKLFTRYAADGIAMLGLLRRSLPLWLQYRSWQTHFNKLPVNGVIKQQESAEQITLYFGRNLHAPMDSPLRGLFARCANSEKDLILDFQETNFASGGFAGMLLLLARHQRRNGRKLTIRHMHEKLARIFALFGLQKELLG